MEVYSVFTERFTEATTHICSRISTIPRLRGPSHRRVDTAHAHACMGISPKYGGRSTTSSYAQRVDLWPECRAA